MCSRVPQADSLPEELRFLSPLVGNWKGQGEGNYPTVDSFKYNETTTFSNNGKPFLSYVQKTSSQADDKPMHTESGYIRVRKENDETVLEFVVSDPTGIASVFDGQVAEDSAERLVLKFTSKEIVATPSAKKVSGEEREFTFSKESKNFQYTVKMAAEDQPMTGHLSATLKELPPVALSPEEVHKLDDPVLIDVRESEEFEAGHFHKAISCPMGKLISQSKKPTDIRTMMENTAHPIIVFCASGLRAGITADEFRSRGLNHVFALNCSWEKL